MSNSLENMENYNVKLVNNILEIHETYSKLIVDYVWRYGNELPITENEISKKFNILIKGIDSISSVFKILLLKTNNLELTKNHSEKAIFYYIEFIGQISEDNHSFLQLGPKDAMLFVYKKTIFDLPLNYMQKEIKTDFELMNKVTSMINFIKNMIKENLYSVKEINSNSVNNLKAKIDKINFYIPNILKSDNSLNLSIINYIEQNTYSVRKNRINLFELILKKLCKYNLTEDNFKKINTNLTNYQNIKNLSDIKFVNYIFQSL